MSSTFSGVLFLIVGPSGVGKGTAITLLKDRHPEWVFPVSATTRSPRPSEVEGETYHFFSMEDFNNKIQEEKFIEWAWVHEKHKYGMLRSEIFPPLSEGRVVLREVDIQGFLEAQDKVPPENLCSIFLLPPAQEDLVRRIKSRAPISDEELERRLQSMEKEMSYANECHYRIQTVEGNFEYPADEIENIVYARMSEKRKEEALEGLS